MSAPEVQWTEQAATDLHEIFLYIAAAGNPLTARRYVDEIAERCERLAIFPHMGRRHEEAVANLRTVPFRSVLIAYLVEPATVRILRILDQRRDTEPLLRSLTRPTP
jgi:toxin ParE1/3/4